MNAVEIEEAVSNLALQPFDRTEFPYEFLRAFGNKETTIKRLRSGTSNKSDLGGVLQTNNIHIAVAQTNEVTETLVKLKASPVTTRAKARFILATDGVDFEAEDMETGETVACAYQEFPDHFGFFLPLAGITTVKQVRESSFDIRATSRLNRLYIELLKDNPEWGTAAQSHEMNHFMARLIFCFFAEDTDIFNDTELFTNAIVQMTERDSSNTHEVISEIFRAMNTKYDDRANSKLPRWTNAFPYVNGGLFSGNVEVPRFSKIARTYLLHIGSLDWTKINPDIFGSMIQAVADDEERGALGMHYTSVPNILKVLNPLFLDDLRARLEEAGNNHRMLLNLRKRLARIRVFDPACGSGNFLVIAYKQMREIENTINERRSERGRKSDIPLTNFRGIELRDFSAEIARLALIIAEYQCDVLYRGQKEALDEFLPLDSQNWITCGNALRLDWMSVCPPLGTGVKLQADDLFDTPLDQVQIDFENEGGETYICGNPPYVGDKKQSESQKEDMRRIFDEHTSRWRSFDYICGFIFKAADYLSHTRGSAVGFVSTNSVCQGMQVAEFWPLVLARARFRFAVLSFKWTNLAAYNAGVICVVVGLARNEGQSTAKLIDGDVAREVESISPYLTAGQAIYVAGRQQPLSDVSEMLLGNFAKDGGHLLLSKTEVEQLDPVAQKFVRPIFGAREFIQGAQRFCLWIEEEKVAQALESSVIKERIRKVAEERSKSPKKETMEWSKHPYRFVEIRSPKYTRAIIVPRVSSENRPYLPVGLLPERSIRGQLTKRKISYAKPREAPVEAEICPVRHVCSAAKCSRPSG